MTVRNVLFQAPLHTETRFQYCLNFFTVFKGDLSLTCDSGKGPGMDPHFVTIFQSTKKELLKNFPDVRAPGKFFFQIFDRVTGHFGRGAVTGPGGGLLAARAAAAAQAAAVAAAEL